MDQWLAHERELEDIAARLLALSRSIELAYGSGVGDKVKTVMLRVFKLRVMLQSEYNAQ